MPKLKILAWNFATWATFPQVLLHKSLKFSKFYQELTQELKNLWNYNLSWQLNLVSQELSYEHCHNKIKTEE